jgi:alkanesulfonate monooxygenase SsuD/methylene tetrahydromethanopterin reductase-like flavin-dependent oxidoreductase (luciferase family)
LVPPVESLDWNSLEEAAVAAKFRAAIVGGPETVQAKLEEFIRLTKVDELMIVTNTFEHADRLRSYEIVANVAELSTRTGQPSTAASAHTAD